MIEHRNGEHLLRRILPDNEVIKKSADLAGCRNVVEPEALRLVHLVVDDFVAQVDALVADVHRRAGDELLDLLLRLRAERALDEFRSVTELGHVPSPA